MQASITTQRNGMVVAVLDAEAARVTFASVIFAARFHEEICSTRADRGAAIAD